MGRRSASAARHHQPVERLGGFGEALLLDQRATGEKARRELGCKPSRPSAPAEIANGGYDPS
ncbi:hypothetical protein GCM10010172_80430 [Paractinoplanes ferrugineus]|uniref:Uncharacterized protein n=1 Tax=Paractinoplanes ferrugineus TaxID=113564 RepID=A0A919IY84_9ACTN|nr:hypothetical protein [Actinoplanes ferrugineus]GIE10364.1 hypothetical protein Afe05nite_22040 [Actinoplanes ferrugineus]